MILVDTSAWIEFLRDTGSSACEAVDRRIADDLAICDPVSMEVLAGACNEHHLTQLRGLLGRATMLPTTSNELSVTGCCPQSRSDISLSKKGLSCHECWVVVRWGAWCGRGLVGVDGERVTRTGWA